MEEKKKNNVGIIISCIINVLLVLVIVLIIIFYRVTINNIYAIYNNDNIDSVDVTNNIEDIDDMANINDIYRADLTVSEKDTALAMGSGGLEVFATPAMIALMENAAFTLPCVPSSKKNLMYAPSSDLIFITFG